VGFVLVAGGRAEGVGVVDGPPGAVCSDVAEEVEGVGGDVAIGVGRLPEKGGEPRVLANGGVGERRVAVRGGVVEGGGHRGAWGSGREGTDDFGVFYDVGPVGDDPVLAALVGGEGVVEACGGVAVEGLSAREEGSDGAALVGWGRSEEGVEFAEAVAQLAGGSGAGKGACAVVVGVDPGAGAGQAGRDLGPAGCAGGVGGG
jgi:hypothetical protein